MAAPAVLADIERYVRLLAERERREKELYAKPVVVGSMGQPAPNPLLYVVKELTREIEKLREELGILPLARIRLGLMITQQRSGVEDLRRRLDRDAREPRRVFGPQGEEVEALDDDRPVIVLDTLK